ncbi:ATPase family AAA domain-containing protein 5 isoform X2 [Stegostoma tigrinum]|uniref:ATPase family AAA domain-containing protein 5 isoform X2 n=1 Tax=Stegostoma tigrinum TaxID=3053191 RepID=UPI0028700B21|nr:ATPase family AAA domain-containing protein 5 isoform X2 [Stegostoma tigrinum]
MVGIIAMARMVEEHDQPCKKQKKDAEDSYTKTITSYFSPVSKSLDMACPSPKSGNIMDYFKKTPGQNVASVASSECERKNSAVISVDYSRESVVVSEGKHQISKRKRLSRRTNLSRKLNECRKIVEINDSSNCSVGEVCDVRSGIGVLGSDTAALIAQLCAESQDIFKENEESVYMSSSTLQREIKGQNRKDTCNEVVSHSSKRITKKTRKRKALSKPEGSSEQSDVELVTKDDYCEEGIEVAKSKGATIPMVLENEKIHFSETGLEPPANETPQANDSTVTVSFEDFMKDQGTEEPSAEKAAEANSEIIEERNKLPNLIEDMSSVSPQPISPKTVTVHVQIHSSPLATSAQNSKVKQKKIASIFLRKKADSESEVIEIQQLSPHPAESHDSVPARRSNVVIAEEELELLVLDATEKSPMKAKCSRAEREQFMNAFRRPPSSDQAKNALKRVTQKSKASKQGLAQGEGSDDEPNLEKGKGEFVQTTNAEISSQVCKDSRVESRESVGATLKKKKMLKLRKLRAECKNLDSCETTGEEFNPDLNLGCVTSKESRDRMPLDLTTARSNETCRTTRRSLRQQRDALDNCQTPHKAIGVDCLGIPACQSTPKLKHWSSKENSFYKAEMIPMTCSKSPIRMKFTRITRSKTDVKAKKTDENMEFTPRSNQRMYQSKHMVKAKKLVEKAKARSKCRSPAESVTPLRRSTRQQAKSDEKYHGAENLAINWNTSADSDSVSVIEYGRKSKKLRNLSDLLGKNPGSISTTKRTVAELKVASIFCGKKTVKNVPSGPITIDDDNSCNESENSQETEQLRAKRQFLMSGLPDTLKKHIAKTAAVVEVCSVANTAFQTVVHVQQKSQVSLLWDLAWPKSAILSHLRDMNEGIERILKDAITLGDFSEVKYTFNTAASWPGLSTSRTEFPQDIQKCLLEEIRSSNPEFPVRKLFKPLLQKRNEHLAQTVKAGPSNKLDISVIEIETEPQQMLPLYSSPQQSFSKRKRKKERQQQKQKRRKTLDGDLSSVTFIGDECTPAMSAQCENSTKRNSKGAQTPNDVSVPKTSLRRLAKQKHQELKCIIGAAETQDIRAVSRVPELIDQPKMGETATSDDPVKEDLLWTEQYQPQHSSELVGNLNAVRKLHSWLMEWKKRADKEEKKKQKEKKTEKDKKLDVWDNSDFNLESSEDEDFLCNTVLITGPPGVGKTAAVYACAQELGFKVFEVNASSQRSGRQILSQLKEATQSHQVDKQGTNALKPAFFNSNRFQSSQTTKSPKKPRKNSKAQKSNLQIVDITRDHTLSENKDTGPEESSKKSATSLILFEEVDIIFDDDAGFLNAIKTFMATAKRPVILTTTDPNFSLTFECCFEEICFKVPSLANVASYLQLLCLAENLRTDVKDLTALLAVNNCDIRQSILHLQFWVRSGGGYHMDKLLPAQGKSMAAAPAQEELLGNAVAAEDALEDLPESSSIVKMEDVPKCSTGCTESLLGFTYFTGPSSNLFSMFKQEVISLDQWRSQVHTLLEFQRRQIDFVFHNLQFLLPLPVRIVPDLSRPENLISEHTEPSISKPTQTAGRILQGADISVDASTVKILDKTKHHRKATLFDDSDLFDTDESDTFVILPNDIPTSPCVADKAAVNQASGVSGGSPSRNETDSSRVIERKPRTSAEQKCSELVSLCLGSLAEFTDNISFLDCCLHTRVVETEGSCGQRGYYWAAAEIKNGMLDERRAESGDWWPTHSFLEIRATVEALSWKKCHSQIHQTMESAVTKCQQPEENPLEKLTLHIPNHQRSNALFTQCPHYLASIASKRIEVLKTVFSSKAFVNLGNRRANAVEYLPSLRTICRTEKLKEQGKLKRRFLHYLDSVHLELPKSTLKALATSFP